MNIANPTHTDSVARVPALIYAARAVRDFGDGFIVLLLPVYLTALGLGPFEIGVVATLALLGSALSTLGIGFLGSRYDARSLLIAASGVMLATGLIFAATTQLWIVFLIAFVGTINPSSGNVSLFVPLEHSVLTHAVGDKMRTAMFARYSLIGALAAAVGSLGAASPDLLATFGVSQMTALRWMFVAYGLLGIVGGLLYRMVPADAPHTDDQPKSALGPSRNTVYKLAALFSLDSFAGGLAVQSLFALWLFDKFGVSLATAGAFFFWAGLLSAFSYPVAAWLSRHIGLINTMVFTHIPANLLLIAAAVSPNVEMALGFMLVRAGLSQMDVPARSSYVMAVVTPRERTAAASFTSVPRSLASAISPAIAGAMFAAGLESWPFVICGVLKIVYDLALLWSFSHVKPPEEQRVA